MLVGENATLVPNPRGCALLCSLNVSVSAIGCRQSRQYLIYRACDSREVSDVLYYRHMHVVVASHACIG